MRDEIELPDSADDPVLLAVWAYGDGTLSVLQHPQDRHAFDFPQRVIVRLDDPSYRRPAEVEVMMPSLSTLARIHRTAIAAAPGLAVLLADEATDSQA